MPNTTRRAVFGLVGAGAAATMLRPGRAAAATPADTLVIAKNIDDILSLDPAEVYEFSSGEIINNVYDRLITFDPADYSKPVGGAVESWTVSPDGRTYTFKVRKGLKFGTGRALVAKDIVYSLTRVVVLNKTPGFILTQFGWTAQNAADLIKAPDDDTVVLTFDKAYAPSFIINILSAGVASVVDSEVLTSHEANGDYGYAWLKTRSAGSGAYRIVTWNAKQAVVLEAASSYWRGTPPIKRIVFNHVAEATAQRLLVEKGDADIARDLTADQIHALASSPALAFQSAPKTTIIYFQLNQTYEPLTKPKVQEAFRWLADYQGMADSFLKGQYGVREGFITTGLPGALTEAPYHLDVAKAKQLLTEAGYPNGFDLEVTVFNTAPYTQIAQSLQATLGQAGIRVKLTQLDKAEVFTIIRARKHQATLAYWSPDYLDDNSTANWFGWCTDIADNAKTHTAAWRNHWLIPELSKETDDALLEPDTAKRNATYEDIQRKTRDSGPLFVLFEQNEQIVLRKNVTGFVLGPSFDTPVYWQTKKARA